MPTYDEAVLADGPVFYAKVEELSGIVLTDYSVTGRNGVINPSTSPTDVTLGLAGPIETDASPHAASGALGYVSTSSGDVLDLRDSFTWEGWARNSGSVNEVILVRNGGPDQAWSNGVWFDSSGVVAEISFSFGGSEMFILTASTLLDIYYHVVVTRNGPVMRLYINADLVAERSDLPAGSLVYAGYNNTDRWRFGYEPNLAFGAVWHSAGESRLALYPTALSPTQILTHYEAAINQILLHGYANVVPTAVLYSDIPATPVSFPFRHNWDSRLIERITFRTNITRARTGIEEGWIVRPKPRREIELVQVLKNNDERKRLRAQLWAHQNATWFVPIRQDVALLDSPLTNGDTVIPVVTTYMDYEVGGYIGLRQLADDGSITHWEYQQITAVNALSVECAPLTYDYEANKSHVYPARRALLDKSISVKGHAAEVEELTIIARLLAEDEATVPNRITVWHPTIKYRDYEIFDPSVWQSNDWDELRDYSIDRELDDIDFSDGVFGVDADTPGAAEAFSYRMKLEGRDEIAKLLGWFYERAGSGRYLWVPSMQRDYDILGVNNNLLTVAGTNYTDNFAGAEARRDLAFVYNDLTMKFRRVLDFTDDPETLTLDADVPSLTNLKFVSILKFCRLDADSLEIAWETNTKATFSWRFRELAHSPEGTGVSSLSPSTSASFSGSPSASQSPSASISQSASRSPSASGSPSSSVSPSVSPSHSTSPSVSPSQSVSPSSSMSPSVSPSGSQSPSASESPSVSPSSSTSPSSSASPSAAGIDPFADGAGLWLRADDSAYSGLSDDVPIGETSVTEWVNEGTAGGSWDAPGAGANDRPRYRTSGPNSKPYIQSLTANGNGGKLVSDLNGSSYLSTTAYHIFMVCRVPTGATIPSGTPNDSTTASMTVNTGYITLPVSNQKWGVYHYSGNYLEFGSTYNLDEWYIVERYFSGGTVGLKVNGGTAVTASFGNIGNLGGPMSILVTTTNTLRVDIAEMIAFSTEQSSGLASTYRSSLGAKYGITVT